MSRINTNVPSLVAAHVLSQNQASLNQALQRLSTGLRINKGKDDPAGLIASETLRGEITAINGAIDNANRANNVLSITEGALQEVNSLTLDLQGLVDTTANSAGLSTEEVAANQLQVDSILDSINRIANSTEFQGKKLLNGTLDYTTSGITTGSTASAVTHLQVTAARIPVGSFRNVVVEVTQSAQTARLTYSGSSVGAGGATLQLGGKYGTEQLSFASGTSAADVVTAINGAKTLTGVSATYSAGAKQIYFNSTDYGSEAFVSVEAIDGTFTVTGGDSSTKDHGVDVGLKINGTQATTNGLDVATRSSSLSLEMSVSSAFAQKVGSVKTFSITGGGATFSIAPTLGVNAMASLGIQSVSTGSLGRGNIGYLSSLGSGQTNQLTSGNFAEAQRIVQEASKQVSSLRGRIGAFQKNTLDSTVNALSVALENTTAAESAIRDADFASETSKLTRAQILVNSSTTVLKLANSAPQSVLTLMS